MQIEELIELTSKLNYILGRIQGISVALEGEEQGALINTSEMLDEVVFDMESTLKDRMKENDGHLELGRKG